MNAKKTTQRQGFKTNEFIVYPAHGVGQIMSIEEQEVAGARLELFVINFVKDKMTLRVPTSKVMSVGMRKLAETPMVKRALETLKGRARIKRTMWSRRAQEYEAKINSGDIVAIAEVVRDLFRSETQPEQSYSERQLYEAALDRLSREVAAVQRLTETEAVKEIEAALAKGPHRGPKPEAEGAVLVELDFGTRAGGVYEKSDSTKFGRKLSEALKTCGSGYYGGSVVIPETTTLLCYGADAEALFSTVEPLLRAEPMCGGARITVRQGGRHREVLLPGRVM